jgi:hypothetical protein
MTWPLVEVPNPFYGPEARPWNSLPPGSCWRVPVDETSYLRCGGKSPCWPLVRQLSKEFFASGRRYAIFIVLPGGAEWSPDCLSSESGQGWTVTGELPAISVSPSVHQIGRYHGFVQNGVLTDDLEGRTYE